MNFTTVTFINNADGSVEAHKPGCRDIARKLRRDFPLADTINMDVSSKRNAFLEFNAELIADLNGDESYTYDINFLPCLSHLPADD